MSDATNAARVSYPEVEDRLAVLEELAPGAVDVTCLDESFQLVEAPDSLTAMGFKARSWDIAGQQRPLHRVREDQRPLLMGLLGQARSGGIASSEVHDDELGEAVMLHVIDLIDVFGVYAFVRGGNSARALGVESAPVAPRRLVQRRDSSAHFLWVDQATTALLGWTCDELEGTPALDLIHPDDADRAVDSWLMMVAGSEPEPVRLRYRDRAGSYRWFEAHNTNCLNDPEQAFVETELIDIHAEMGALARARESELHFATLTESLPIGVVQLNAHGEVAFANGWMKELTGQDTSELSRLAWMNADDQASFSARVQRTLRDAVDQECDIRVLDPLSRERICRVRLRAMPSPDGGSGAIASFEDVTSSRDIQDQLREQALNDELTGLSNRRGLHEWLDQHQEVIQLRGLTVFFVDLDDFKLVNDVKGHAAGDDILVAVSAQITALVRPEDHVARIGGDEFVIACPGITDQTVAGEVARRVVDCTARPFIIDNDVVWLGCSVGIAIAEPNQRNTDRLLSDADVAMYEAKRSGGRSYAFFEEKQRQGVERRLRVENELRVALTEGQFELYLQPIVNLVTGQTRGAEALVRWNHPDLELVAPGQFIPAAERTGMIHTLGAWILDQACAIAATWPEGRITVNISPPQLARSGFVDLVQAAIDRHGIRPEALVLEVTETVFLDMNENTLMVLAELVRTGVRVALDDFGTGFSSLNHLRQIPAQVVKIDRSYITDLGVDAGTTAIVEAMVGLTRSLGQELIAEGIETEEQARLLREMGVVFGQGYLLGRPIPAALHLAKVAAAGAAGPSPLLQ